MIDYKIHNDHRLFPKENTIEAHHLPEKKISTENNPFIHSQIYSLSSTVTEKKATSSNQAIRPVESSSSARRGPSTRRSEGEGRKEGIVGVLLARSVPVGFTPPPPVRPN